MRKLISLLLCLFAFGAHASDAIETPHYYHTNFYVGFANKETLAAELVWQALNVVDTMQTIQTAKNPACFQEVGQLAIISNHPTTHQVYYGMISFAAIHYLIAKGIDSLVVQNPDYMVVQRVYQYGNLAYKTDTVVHNFNIGVDLNHSRNCLQ